MFVFLLRKEVKDFLECFKSIFIILIVSLAPIFSLKVSKEMFPVWCQLWLTQMIIGQFFHDSYLLDIKDGGILFLINSRINIKMYFFVKILFGVFISFIPVLLNLKAWNQVFEWYDYIWYVVSLCYCGLLMFIFLVLNKGEEIVTSIIVSIIMGVILLGIYFSPLWLRFLDVILLNFICFVISLKLYKSLYFKGQL